MKFEHMKPTGLLNTLPIREWKWELILMDFVERLPTTQKKHNVIWVVIEFATQHGSFEFCCSSIRFDECACSVHGFDELDF